MLRSLCALTLAGLVLTSSRLDATVERLAAPPSAGAELWTECPTTELESTLFADAADGRLDDHSLLSAALVASGCADTTQRREHQRPLQDWVDRVAADLSAVRPPRRKAERLLERLHDDLLVGHYRAESSDLRELVRKGDYNCVGATVVYLAACRACGLPAAAQEMPGHVRCRVWLDGGWRVVEPTCREWFAVLADEKQLQRLEVPESLRAVWGDPSQGRVLSPLGLIAMIYYNRGLDRLDARDWSGAVTANQKALRLDPHSRTARANLLAIWNNWALQLSAQGDHATAEEMLDRGVNLAPEFTTFRLNLGVVRQRRAEQKDTL